MQNNAAKQSRPIQLHPSWLQHVGTEFEKPYMQNLRAFLQQRKQQGAVVYPAGKDIFNALNLTPFEQVKVVILGQDPYHGEGQAHGLSFSVKPPVSPPPSLQNMFKEIEADLGIKQPRHGCLEAWAQQGVLLLNATLTVEQSQAGAHQGKGWETFTDAIISSLNDVPHPVVFLLWGSYAGKKAALIRNPQHLVLKAPHPSPLSAHRGFMGCRHFSQANTFLQQQGLTPINWQLPALT